MANYKSRYEGNMYYGAESVTRQRAKRLRRKMTEGEGVLWEQLRNRKTGFKFRRQHPIGFYIADFYCHELKLVIEVDGELHNFPDQKEWDNARNSNMNMMDIIVFRFTNNKVINETETVVSEIQVVCKELCKSI